MTRNRLTRIATALLLGLLALSGPLSSSTAEATAYGQPTMSLVGQCLGTPVLLGVIDYTAASKTQATATTPFSNTGDGLAAKTILLQPTTAVYILPGTSSSVAAASTTSLLVQAGERICFYMHQDYTHLAAIRSATSGNLLVFEMKQ